MLPGPRSPAARAALRCAASLALALAVDVAASGAALAKPPVAPAAGPPGPRDRAALRLDSEALGKDYLETNFIRAEKRLQQAIRMCGPKACSPRVLAQLHRDLGVVYAAGLGKLDAGKDELKAAFEIDSSIDLDPDYATPDLKKLWNQVRGVKAARTEEARSASGKQGFSHTPVQEQAIATPVPIFASYSGSNVAKLRLWYRPVGADRWAYVNMEPGSSGYTGEIPCSASTKTGELPYFIEALSDSEETVDKEGSRAEPHVVNIVKELSGEAPHLPDAPPPEVCKDVCTGDDCTSDGKKKGPRNNWFILSVEQDFAIVGGGTGVCTPDIQVNGAYSCFRATGSQYHGNPIADPGDNVNGGLAIGTTRIHIGYDRVIAAGFVLGVRLGYVLHGLGPRADGANVHAPLPLHLEGRAAYWFGKDVFSTNGFRPYLFVNGGLAQVDAKFGVVVQEDTSVPPPPTQTDNPPAQHLDAYRRMGQGFLGGGLGAMYAFTPGIGLLLDVKYMHLLPTSGNAISPEFGFAVGF